MTKPFLISSVSPFILRYFPMRWTMGRTDSLSCSLSFLVLLPCVAFCTLTRTFDGLAVTKSLCQLGLRNCVVAREGGFRKRRVLQCCLAKVVYISEVTGCVSVCVCSSLFYSNFWSFFFLGLETVSFDQILMRVRQAGGSCDSWNIYEQVWKWVRCRWCEMLESKYSQYRLGEMAIECKGNREASNVFFHGCFSGSGRWRHIKPTPN